MDKGFKFSGFSYEDSIDTFMKCHYDKSYCCVLFDIAKYILDCNTDEIIEFRYNRSVWTPDCRSHCISICTLENC